MPKKSAKNNKAKTSNSLGFSKLSKKLKHINRVITHLESEVETLVKKIVKKGELSGRELRRSFDDLVDWLKAGALLNLASEKRDDLEREIKRLADEVIQSVREIELLPKRIGLKQVMKNVQKNFSSIVSRFSDSDLLHQARLGLGRTKKGFLEILSIPTQDEVVKLEKKLVSLEKRLSNLSRKAA